MQTVSITQCLCMCTIINLCEFRNALTQGGSDGYDVMHAATSLNDEGVVASGFALRSACNNITSAGSFDMVAVKLDSSGKVVWCWQVTSHVYGANGMHG